MSSNLACIGLAVTTPQELSTLIADVTRLGTEEIGDSHGIRSQAYQDASGARVVYDLVAGRPLILPSFATATSFAYRGLEASSPHVAKVTLVGEDGAADTGVTCELEQRRHLDGYASTGRIGLTAFGVNIAVFADESDFLASDASLLGSEDELGPPPPEVVERSLAWPPRMSAAAFFANGFYDGPVEPSPHALMSALVTAVETRDTSLTGQKFQLARVRTSFGELDLCAPASLDFDLEPGRVIAGTVAMVGRLMPASVEPAAEVDDRPIPGETRRAWRARTGRL